MRPAENIKKLIQGASIKTNPKVNKAVLNSLFDELDKSKERSSATLQPNIWRMIMKSRITKFAVAAAIIIAAVLTINTFHKSIPVISTASAAQVLTEAAKAVENVRSIHIKARMRTLPGDNFGLIGLEFDFVPIEMWKKVDDKDIVCWRIEKPGRVIVTNEDSTIMLMKPNGAIKERPCPIGSFDTWYGRLMNVDEIIDNVLEETMERSNDQLCVYNEVFKEGTELVLETESTAQGDFTNDWCRNAFITESDHKKVYRFDAETKLLKSFKVYVHADKEDVLIFEVTDIEYNPQVDNSLFNLELPQDVIWYEKPKVLADNEKYQKMTPKQATEAFFKACADKNWDEVLKFWSASRIDERLKEYLGGLEIISIGEPFKSGLYAGWLVPYEIKLQPTEINVRLSNANAAGRYVIMGMYDSKLQLTEEMKWSDEPEVLTDNDAYAKMSPEEVAKAYFGAFSRLDWDEMQKFVPASDVKGMKGEFEEAANRGIDVREQLPTFEAEESFWSAEHSAYFVKCRQSGRIKKWNLAVRNDNPAKRWVVDGGI